jgi:alkylhydroperoxidase family enzyme
MPHPSNYTSKIAIPLPSNEAIKEIIGDNYNSAAELNVIKMMAGTEDMFEATAGFIKAMFQAKGVDPTRIREMIMLRAAKVLNSPYEWQANTILARNVGLSEDEIESTASDGPVANVDPRYVLLCKATDELSASATLTDETLTELLHHFGEVVTRKYILIIGWFNLLSRFLNGCRVPLESTDKFGNNTSPLS